MSPQRESNIMIQTRPQQGFSLIEALIALVVLSVGLVGLAGLLVQGIKTNHNAYLRTQAVLLSSDIAERMLANPAGLHNGDYNDINTASENADPGCVTTNRGCDPAQMARYDAYAWGRALSSALPAGVGTVTGAGSGSVFNITVSWSETGHDAGNPSPTITSFTTSFQP